MSYPIDTIRRRVWHPDKLKSLKCPLGELGNLIIDIDKLDLVIKNIENSRLAADNLCKLGKLNHWSALRAETLKLLGLRSLTCKVLLTLRGLGIAVDDNLGLTFTAIAKSVAEAEDGILRENAVQVPDGEGRDADVTTDTDLPRGPLTSKLEIPLGGHARLASANGARIGEGAGTVALQDGADREGDGLALGGNLELFHHALDPLLTSGLLPHLTDRLGDNLEKSVLAGLHDMVEHRLALLLGGNTPLEDKLNLLGRRRPGEDNKLALMVAARRKARSCEAEGINTSETDHVAELLKQVVVAEVGGLSVVHQFHVNSTILPKIVLLGMLGGTAVDYFEAGTLEDRCHVKVLLDDGIGTDLVGDELNLTLVPLLLGKLERGRQLAIGNVKPDINVHGRTTAVNLLINTSVDILSSEGDDGSNTTSDTPVNKNLKGGIHLGKALTRPHDITAKAATDGGNNGCPHFSKDGHTEVGGNDLLIGRHVDNTLPVEGALTREGALQETGVLKDVLQVLNTAGGEAPEESGILQQLHVDISLRGPVLTDLDPKLLNGLAPLMTQLTLDLLTRGVGEARDGVVEGGEDVPLVEAGLHGGVLVFLSHEVHSLVIQVRGNDGVLR